MAASHKNRVQMSVSGTPGTGTITLGSASSGYQSFATAYGGDATVDILITDGTAWEVARNCTYTNSGTTVTRGTLEASSTGSAISLTSAAIVSNIATAAWGNQIEALLQGLSPGGRLTLTSGTPVTTSDVTGATSVYYTPYIHNVINLWDGADWVPTTFTEQTLAVGTVTSGLPYDVFGYLSSGALAVEKLAWTNGTTRATAVTLQDGRYCKSGDKTRLLLGTFYTTSTSATEDSEANRYLWNAYNRVSRNSKSAVGTQHTYSGTTLREWNNGASTVPRAYVIAGLGVAASAFVQAFVTHSAAQNSTIRAYLDGSTDISGTDIQFYTLSAAGAGAQLAGAAATAVSAGRHYLTIFEAEYTGNSVTYEKGSASWIGWTA